VPTSGSDAYSTTLVTPQSENRTQSESRGDFRVGSRAAVASRLVVRRVYSASEITHSSRDLRFVPTRDIPIDCDSLM